uniref:Uncharacterized protein n=1 Tax=Arundo donax TaxID=35708 RepID=A0A0A9A3Y4_ARUDO
MDVFQEPTELPPTRDVDRTIPLQQDAKPINIRPYRLSHKQKNAMEDLIVELLQNNVIRPSVSPYCSPAILVRKRMKHGDYALITGN